MITQQYKIKGMKGLKLELLLKRKLVKKFGIPLSEANYTTSFYFRGTRFDYNGDILTISGKDEESVTRTKLLLDKALETLILKEK